MLERIFDNSLSVLKNSKIMFSVARTLSRLRIKNTVPGAGAAPKQAGSETLVNCKISIIGQPHEIVLLMEYCNVVNGFWGSKTTLIFLYAIFPGESFRTGMVMRKTGESDFN